MRCWEKRTTTHNRLCCCLVLDILATKRTRAKWRVCTLFNDECTHPVDTPVATGVFTAVHARSRWQATYDTFCQGYVSCKCTARDSMQVYTNQPTVLSLFLALDGVSSLFASSASPAGSPNRDPSPTSDCPDRAPSLSLLLTARCEVQCPR